MPALGNRLAASDPDRIHHPPVAGEHGGIQQRVSVATVKGRTVRVQNDEVRQSAGLELAGGDAQGLGAAPRRRLVQEASAGRLLAGGQQRATALGQTLAVLQQPELFHRADGDVAVGADAEASTAMSEFHRREQPVTQVGLGGGAQTRHRAA